MCIRDRIGATQEGQIQMREIIRDRLQRVHRDPKGVPQKIVLFPGRPNKQDSADIVIDPRFSFGRPVIDRFGVRTAILAERFDAGDDIDVLAREYAAPAEAIQNARRPDNDANSSKDVEKLLARKQNFYSRLHQPLVSPAAYFLCEYHTVSTSTRPCRFWAH